MIWLSAWERLSSPFSTRSGDREQRVVGGFIAEDPVDILVSTLHYSQDQEFKIIADL